MTAPHSVPRINSGLPDGLRWHFADQNASGVEVCACHHAQGSMFITARRERVTCRKCLRVMYARGLLR
jgi:hypothetical protein